MKKGLILIIALLFSNVSFAQGWGITTPFDEKRQTPATKSQGYIDDLGKQEARWTVDLEGLAWVMPDQPARDQTVTTLTGFGTTYKFSNKLHLVGKWIQFDIKGGDGVEWHHDHLLFGGGARSFFNAGEQQWQLNFLTGFSTVTGNKGVGNVGGLEMPMFLDMKYLWVYGGNVLLGPQVTFGRVPNKCTDPNGTYLACGHGGYTSIGFSVQFGLPKEWGQ